MTVTSKGERYTLRHRVINAKIYQSNNIITSLKSNEFQREIVYVNNTDRIVSMGFRNGVKVSIGPNGAKSGTFLIVERYNLSANALKEFQQMLHTLQMSGCYLTDDVKELIEQVERLIDPRKINREGTLELCHSYTFDVFSKDTYYLVEDDVVLVLGDKKFLPPHPSSPDGQSRRDFERLKTAPGSQGFTMTIVDNENQVSDRYLYIAGKMLMIRPIVSHERGNGVYIQWHNTGEGDMYETFIEQITLKEAAERFGLSATQELARNFGDNVLAAERMKKELEERARQSKIEYEQRLHELEVRLKEQTIELERERQRTKMFFEQQSMSRKDHYDERDRQRSDEYEEKSSWRKNVMEIFKYMPALILSIIGALAIFKQKEA